ncbi:MAG: energy transducer TonB [Spirochaetota bacterium]
MLVHTGFISGYFAAKHWPTESIMLANGMDMPPAEIELDIPPELIGGTSSPAPVDKQEWVEGKKKTGDDPDQEDINTNQISGDGTDRDGYLFSFNGDKKPSIIADFDLRQYFPLAAKEANVTQFSVTVLVQVDEQGRLVSASVASGPAPYGFNDAALKIVHRARFSPGYKAGHPVKMAHWQDISFVLED